MIRRLLFGGIVGLLLTTVLLSGAGVGEKVKLVWTARLDNPPRTAMFQQWVDEYMKQNPGVTIELVPGGIGDAYYENLMTWILGNTAADIMWFGVDVWRFADFLLPLDELYAKDPLIREVLPNMINTLRWEGKLIGIPFGVNAHVFWYNKDIFAKYGVNMPAKWTWDDALAMGRKFTVDTDGDVKMNQWGIHMYVAPWALTYGGNAYTPDLRRAAVDNPAAIAGTQLVVDLYTGRNPVGFGTKFGAATGVAGNIAMGNMGVWEIPTLRDKAPFDWDVTLFPDLMVNGAHYNSSFYSPEIWSIYKGTKYPEEARKFLNFIMNHENMGDFATLGTVIPTQPSVAARSFLKIKVPEHVQLFAEALNYWKSTPSDHPGYSTLGWYGSTWTSVLNGTVPAAVGIPEMVRQVNVALDAWWKAKK